MQSRLIGFGTPIDPRNLTRHAHGLCSRAGLPPERLHNLRHTAASIAYAQGLDHKMVQTMLGRSSLGVTMDIYTHMFHALGRAAAKRIGEALAP